MRTVALIGVGVVIALLLLFGCPSQPDSPPPPQQPPTPAMILTGLPIEMTVKQRTTTAVPRSNEAVRLTVDDVTRGQVMASLAGKDGAVLLGPTSLIEGRTVPFKLGDVTYYLTLTNFDNEMVGDDSATFMITDAPPSTEPPQNDADRESTDVRDEGAEKEYVGQLIEHIRNLEGAVFIRNSEEHTPAEAADHLQRKWDYAAEDISTAEEFIEQLASKSSTTGEPYRIRLEDGTEQPSGQYLRERLAELKR
jgi:hypothetical protein